MAQAACRPYNPEWWYPVSGVPRGAVHAVTICLSCPVRIDCLNYALDLESRTYKKNRWGIWGALRPEQRQALHESGGYMA